MRVYLVAVLLLTACTTPQRVRQEPPFQPIFEEEQAPEAAPIDTAHCDALPIEDSTFCDEVDACLATYKECRKDTPDQKCFPVNEKCVVTAYRKWKKAKGME